jgi:hypothetical protein
MRDGAMIRGACHCGAIRWEYGGMPARVTVCNCSLCRRIGAMWAYGFEGTGTAGGQEGAAIGVTAAQGAVGTYVQGDRMLAVHFCLGCGTVSHWRSLSVDKEGRRRMAVNMRLADPADVRAIEVNRFDGAETWTSAPSDGRCISDFWV